MNGTNPDDLEIPASWRLLDDVELMTIPDPAFLVNGVIQDRAIGVLYSPPGTGKTTAIAGLAVAIATGARWFGHQVLDPGPVVVVTAEDAAGFKVRLRAAKRAVGLKDDVAIGVYAFTEPLNLGDPVSVTRFRRFLAAIRFPMPLKLIVVDTYAAATPGASENSSEDTTTAMVHAQQWRDALDCGVLLVHHTNASGSRERGHSGMRGAADYMVALTPLDDLINVTCEKIRNGAPFEKIVLKLTPGPDGAGCVLRLASDVLPAVTLTPHEQRACEALRDSFRAEEGASKTEWEKACLGMATSTFYRVAKTLVERGYVAPVGAKFRLTEKGTRA